MLKIADAAAEYLYSLLEAAEAPEDVASLIQIEEDEVKFKIGQIQAEDKPFRHKGRIILALDELTSDLLSIYTLDLDTTEEQPQLFFFEDPT